MGAVFSVPWTRIDHRGGVDALHDAGFTVAALTPDGGAVALDDVGPTQRLAIAVGSEGPGLSARWLDGADLRVRIPMRGPVDSLNVAAAAAVALYALARPLVSPRARGHRSRLPRHRRGALRRPGVRRGVAPGVARGRRGRSPTPPSTRSTRPAAPGRTGRSACACRPRSSGPSRIWPRWRPGRRATGTTRRALCTPTSLPTLEALRAAGYRLGVIANQPSQVRGGAGARRARAVLRDVGRLGRSRAAQARPGAVRSNPRAGRGARRAHRDGGGPARLRHGAGEGGGHAHDLGAPRRGAR